MSPRDQSFNDRASAFWGHHRLSVEQLARVPGQRKLSLKLRDTFMGPSQLVGLHTWGALDDAGVDQRLALPPKQGRMHHAYATERQNREQCALAARADEQHAWVLAGDERGTYGECTPKQID